MAHGGGAAPNPPIQHRTPAPLPGDPRAQMDEGMKLIMRAFACRESEILQLRNQAAEKDRMIANLVLTLNHTNTRLRGALEQQNAMLLKKWDARCVMLKQWGLSNLKDTGAGMAEKFSKLLAEVAGLKESPIADVKNEEESEAPCVLEEEIRSVLLQRAPLTTQDIVHIFKPRLSTNKRKSDFAESLKKISKVMKRDGQNWVVLKEH